MTIAALVPARAVAVSGCTVASVGLPSAPSTCRFIATGPIDFIAATTSGWRIMRRPKDQEAWIEMARSTTTELRPTHLNVRAGSFPQVQPFDEIELSIFRANDETPAGVVSYQHGFISATSDL